MATEVIQTSLAKHSEPIVLNSYKPKTQKRPGTISEWTEFVGRLAQLSEELYRDARVMRSKRRDAQQAKPGSMAQRDAERDYQAVLRRAAEHCQNLANTFLTTGMPREHLENHLELCGTERDRRPSLGIALLYSKVMGIPFREERITPKDGSDGQMVMERIVEERQLHWAKELKSADAEDFFRATRAFNETMPPLAAKFRRGDVHL